jgi:hypothetical protein
VAARGGRFLCGGVFAPHLKKQFLSLRRKFCTFRETWKPISHE